MRLEEAEEVDIKEEEEELELLGLRDDGPPVNSSGTPSHLTARSDEGGGAPPRTPGLTMVFVKRSESDRTEVRLLPDIHPIAFAVRRGALVPSHYAAARTSPWSGEQEPLRVPSRPPPPCNRTQGKPNQDTVAFPTSTAT